MDKKAKEKEQSQLRQPKAKTNRFGLKVPIIRMPHEDLIKPEHPKLEIVGSAKDSNTLTSQTSQSKQISQTETAPIKNFQKVANSISKQAVPDGWFKGKSKQLYDVLYSLTRGAINPSRKVRVQKSKLMKLSAIGSRITFDSNIQHLVAVGLVVEKVFTGEHEGNEFEVILPEEITLTSQSSQASQSTLTSHAQKLDRLVCLETSQTSQSINSMESTISENPKTSFKTNTIDDEAFAGFINVFNQGTVEVTGKKITADDSEKLQSLAELLMLELRSAARRTGTISNVPAFLTEVLRRKLFNQPSVKQSKAQPDIVGKSEETETSDYEIKALDKDSREAALAELREFADEEFLEDFKKWYTAEDWNWLSEKLKK